MSNYDSDSDFDALAYYMRLPEPLKRQLAKLAPMFEDDEDVAPMREELYDNLPRRQAKHPGVRKIVQRVAMMLKIAPDFFFDEKYFPYVHCYNQKGDIVELEDTITIGKHVFVMQGRLYDEPVIVKWYQSGHRDTQYEIDIYKRLRHIECPTPWFSASYSFWDSPVLVMEKLKPLDKTDNPGHMAAAVIRQLMYLHKFGCHNDIKPGNVMKRVDPDKGPVYFLIDYGGVATHRLRYGYRRWIWSPKWTCQRPHAEDQVTTAKHDFIELGYTWKTMENWVTGEKEIRTGFRGTLAKFMRRVAQIDEKHITSRDYKDLIDIAESN